MAGAAIRLSLHGALLPDSQLAGQPTLHRHLVANVPVGDISIPADHEHGGDAFNLVSGGYLVSWIQEHGEIKVLRGSEARGILDVVVNAYRENLKFAVGAVVLLVELRQGRHFQAAGAAPAGPEGYQHVLMPAVVCQRDG